MMRIRGEKLKAWIQTKQKWKNLYFCRPLDLLHPSAKNGITSLWKNFLKKSNDRILFWK
jgi:hypothetical protein